jgi:hypothetical protein
VHVIEGNTATMRCSVREAFPKATIRWKYTDTQEYLDETSTNGHVKIVADTNNENVDEGGAFIGSWSDLIIDRTTRLDKRNYTCVATNKAAVAERSAQMLVEYSPKLVLNSEARELYYSWIFTDEFGNSGNTASQSARAYPVTFTCIADGEPRPLITWYYKGLLIRIDNIKYRLLRDQPGYSQLELTPRLLSDFGDYQCRAENRHGKEERNIQLREATSPRFSPLVKVRAINPESVVLDILASDAPGADGGMPIESYKVQWRLTGTDWTKPYEKEIPLDLSNIDVLTSPVRDVFNVEINALMPDTDYLFRVAAVNKPGVGIWPQKELRIRTAPRRQPDPVKMLSKEDCQASTRCYIEWVVDSNGGSPIRDYHIKWRRVSYYYFLTI